MTVAYRAPRATLSAATANGDGAAVDVGGFDTISMQVIEDGTVSTGTVTLELSLDGVTWWTTTTVYNAASDPNGEINSITGVAAQYARAVLAAITGGGNVTALIMGA